MASNYQATATTITIDNQQEIKIVPANSAAQVRIEAGPAGRDALASLGLSEGLLTASANTTTSSATTVKTANGSTTANNLKSHYSITVPSTLSLSSSTGISAAQQALSIAVAEVQSIYTDLITPKSTGTSASGTVPAYITNQIANYTLALQRLAGGASGSVASSILAG